MSGGDKFLAAGIGGVGAAGRPAERQASRPGGYPIALLRLSLLRFVDSRFPGKSPWT